MGTVRVRKVIEFLYTIDDEGFSGSEIADNEMTDPVGSAVDGYLEREEGYRFAVIEQSVVIEQETHLSNEDLDALGDVSVLRCGHYEYRSGKCVVDGCSNYIGLSTHGEVKP